MKLPHCTKPCAQCPFRTDIPEGWLGAERMEEILGQPSFTCHKTDKTLQCAGHMIIKCEENEFVRLANQLRIPLNLSGQDLVFKSEQEAIEHHA